MIGYDAIANQRHSVQRNVFPQQIEIDRTIRIATSTERRPFPRWVKWCGTSAATTRANRPITSTQYQVAARLIASLLLMGIRAVRGQLPGRQQTLIKLHVQHLVQE